MTGFWASGDLLLFGERMLKSEDKTQQVDSRRDTSGRQEPGTAAKRKAQTQKRKVPALSLSSSALRSADKLAGRFEKDGRVLQEGQRLPDSGCEWAKAPVFYNGNVAGGYHLLATVWAADGRQFTCRSMIPKGPQSHQYSFGLFNKPT